MQMVARLVIENTLLPFYLCTLDFFPPALLLNAPPFSCIHEFTAFSNAPHLLQTIYFTVYSFQGLKLNT